MAQSPALVLAQVPEARMESGGLDVSPDRLERLQRGERAPRDGFLVEPLLLLDWSFEIRRLRRLRVIDLDAADGRCAVRVGHLESRLEIRAEHTAAMVELWRGRATELGEALRSEQETDVFDSPAFWFGLGIVVAVLGAVGLGLAYRSP